MNWARVTKACCVMAVACTSVAWCVAQEPAAPYQGTFPVAASKKGLQVERVDDALALGINHAAINVDLARLAVPTAAPGDASVVWHENSQGRFALRTSYLHALEETIRSLSDAGVVVYVILLVYESPDPAVNKLMLHPGYDGATPNHVAAFNVRTDAGRAWLSGLLECLAKRWSRPSAELGRVAGYIVGNEVNSHWYWYNCGRLSMEVVARDYAETVRLVHTAIRQQATWPRIYLSLDHHWNMAYAAGDSEQCCSGKAFLDVFARHVKADPRGDFDWHLAYHPYPEDLFDPAFWNDTTAKESWDTPRITFKNLQILPAYLQQPALQFNGESRRVILSEQGFHSAPTVEGEELQAAAFCYAYAKVERLAGIDAFILHRQIDHPQEGGLNLGLRRRADDAEHPDPPKPIYDCFRAAGTPAWDQASAFALPLVGLKSWDDLND